MSSAVIVIPAGSPSTITTRARPCDSPAVRNRNIAGKRTGGVVHGWRRLHPGSILLERENDEDARQGQGRAEGEGTAAAFDQTHRQSEHDAKDASEEQRE